MHVPLGIDVPTWKGSFEISNGRENLCLHVIRFEILVFIQRSCCDRKSWAAYAQSFALWQQATIKFTCHDHSIIDCSRRIYVWCCTSPTSRSWWLTQSTHHHRRGCNSQHQWTLFSKSVDVLQPLRWCCVECVNHHERDVREEQHHTYMWREQAIIEWSWCGSSADINLWTIEHND